VVQLNGGEAVARLSLLGAHQEIKPKRRREIYNDVTELSQPVGSF